MITVIISAVIHYIFSFCGLIVDVDLLEVVLKSDCMQMRQMKWLIASILHVLIFFFLLLIYFSLIESTASGRRQWEMN